MRTPPRRAAAAVLLLAALAALLAAAPMAGAHASRLSCDPAPGARLDAAPQQVVVVLTEPIEPSATTMAVTDQDGRRVDRDDLRVDGGQEPRLTLSLEDGLPSGAYTIAWKVLSKDTHTVSESCGFAVGSYEPPASGQADRGDLDAEAILGRALAYGGLALALGAVGLLVLRPATPPSSPLAPLLVRALAAGAALHTVGLLLLAHHTMGASGLAGSGFLASGVGRNMALRLVLGLAALAVAGLGIVRPTRLAAPVAGLAMLGAAFGSAAYSHSFAFGPAAVVVDFVHLAASACWVGALLLFLIVLGRRTGGGSGLEAGDALRFGTRFGTLALGCVLTLFLTGTTVTLILLGRDRLGEPLALLVDPWGRFLAAKVAVALAMVGLAAANRFVLLAPPAERGLSGGLQRAARRLGPAFAPLPAAGTAGLRRLVAVEAGLGLVVLLLAGALTSISPPSGASGDADGHTDMLHLTGAGTDFGVLAMVLPPPAVGQTSILTLDIRHLGNGTRMAANTCDSTGARTTCVEGLLMVGNATDRRPAHLQDDGSWRIDGVLWTVAGNATLTVRIQTAQVFEDRVALPFRVG